MADKNLSDRHNTYLDMYQEYFGENYPLMMYREPMQESVDRIKKCLEQGKKVSELFPIDISEDILY